MENAFTCCIASFLFVRSDFSYNVMCDIFHIGRELVPMVGFEEKRTFLIATSIAHKKVVCEPH